VRTENACRERRDAEEKRGEERGVSGGGEKNLAGSRRTTTVPATENHPEKHIEPDKPDKPDTPDPPQRILRNPQTHKPPKKPAEIPAPDIG
jgi:hypothetical protein